MAAGIPQVSFGETLAFALLFTGVTSFPPRPADGTTIRPSSRTTGEASNETKASHLPTFFRGRFNASGRNRVHESARMRAELQRQWFR
jgi:hypothetical protein